jgi:cell wall-associated NlpC family hydrolase
MTLARGRATCHDAPGRPPRHRHGTGTYSVRGRGRDRTLFDHLPETCELRSSRRSLLRALISVGVGAWESTSNVTGAGAQKTRRGITTPGRLESPPDTSPGATGPAVDRFVRCVTAQIGKPYVWATAGPDTFDCSGLVAYCYEAATGQVITHSSHAQYGLGRRVSAHRGHLAPGDLVFYDTNGDGAGHVGVVVGPDRAVHALNPARGVCETGIIGANLGGPYLGARRIDGLDAGSPHSRTAQARRRSGRVGRQRKAVQRQARHPRKDAARGAREHQRRRDASLDSRDEIDPGVDNAQAVVVGPGYDCLNDPFLLVPDHDGVRCAEPQPGPATPEDPLDG